MPGAVARVASLAIDVISRTAGFERGMKRAADTTKRFQAAASSSFGGITKTVGAFAGKLSALVGGISAVGMAWRGMRLAAEMEQTNVAFTVLLRSAGKATTVLSDLRKFAAETPFQLTDLSQAAKMLAGFQFQSAELVPTLRMLGDVASALNINLSDMAYLYGTSRTQGRLFARDVMQFSSRGVPVVTALANVLGVTSKEVGDLVSKGKVGFDELRLAMQSMTQAGGQFHGMMAKQSKTTVGQISTIKDNFDALLRKVGEIVLKSEDFQKTMQAISDIASEAAQDKGTAKSLRKPAAPKGGGFWGPFAKLGLGFDIAATWPMQSWLGATPELVQKGQQMRYRAAVQMMNVRRGQAVTGLAGRYTGGGAWARETGVIPKYPPIERPGEPLMRLDPNIRANAAQQERNAAMRADNDRRRTEYLKIIAEAAKRQQIAETRVKAGERVWVISGSALKR